jgi:predicted GNAT family acetyltransferase
LCTTVFRIESKNSLLTFVVFFECILVLEFDPMPLPENYEFVVMGVKTSSANVNLDSAQKRDLVTALKKGMCSARKNTRTGKNTNGVAPTFVTDSLRVADLVVAVRNMEPFVGRTTRTGFVTHYKYVAASTVKMYPEKKLLYIDMFCTDPAVRGLARPLMEKVVEIARYMNFDRVVLSSLPAPLPVYEHFGFRVLRRVKPGLAVPGASLADRKGVPLRCRDLPVEEKGWTRCTNTDYGCPMVLCLNQKVNNQSSKVRTDLKRKRSKDANNHRLSKMIQVPRRSERVRQRTTGMAF